MEAVPNVDDCQACVVRQSMVLNAEDLPGDCLDWAEVMVAAEAETKDLTTNPIFFIG